MTVVAIQNVGVLPVDGGQLLECQTVVFTASPGEIISSNVDGGSSASREDTEAVEKTIQGAGCILIPAFIDSNINTGVADRDLEVFASYGIAAVIDMSSTTLEISAMRTTSNSEIALPTYFAAGAVATAQMDMSQYLYPLRETEAVLLATHADDFVISRITGPDQADFIKVLVDLPGLDEQTLVALVNAAHHHGKLAVAHATQTTSFTRALEAGFDIITPVPLDGIIDMETASGMAARGVACIPTLGMRRKMVDVLQEQARQGLRLTANIEASGSSAHDFEYALANAKVLYEAGVRICAGSDSNLTSHMPIPLGESLHDEIELLVRAGMSNIDALRAATVVPTQVFGLSDRGSLRRGMRADMILLEGNPLEDIRATRRIRKIWLRGVEVEVRA